MRGILNSKIQIEMRNDLVDKILFSFFFFLKAEKWAALPLRIPKKNTNLLLYVI